MTDSQPLTAPAAAPHRRRGRPPKSGALITDAVVMDVRQRYAAGGVTVAALAADCGLTVEAVKLMLTGRTWRHLPLVPLT